MEKNIGEKVSLLETINNFGFGIYLATIGSIGYLVIKGVKKLLDILAESLLQKYIQSIRNEVKIYLTPLKTKIDDIDDEVKRMKKHEKNNSDLQLNLLQDLIGKVDNKPDKK